MADGTNIRVSEAVWRHLNAQKRPGESFDDVLRRELGLSHGHEQGRKIQADINSLVTELDVPGDGELEQRRQEAVGKLLRWARDLGESFRKADVEEEFLTDEIREAVDYGEDRTRWLKLFRPALSECPAVAMDGRSWRWVGMKE